MNLSDSPKGGILLGRICKHHHAQPKACIIMAAIMHHDPLFLTHYAHQKIQKLSPLGEPCVGPSDRSKTSTYLR